MAWSNEPRGGSVAVPQWTFAQLSFETHFWRKKCDPPHHPPHPQWMGLGANQKPSLTSSLQKAIKPFYFQVILLLYCFLYYSPRTLGLLPQCSLRTSTPPSNFYFAALRCISHWHIPFQELQAVLCEQGCPFSQLQGRIGVHSPTARCFWNSLFLKPEVIKEMIFPFLGGPPPKLLGCWPQYTLFRVVWLPRLDHI